MKNFYEEVVNECNNFISFLLEVFENIFRSPPKDMNDDSHDNHNNHNNNSVYYLHMNKLNNVINYMLLYDKECCANFNDILNLFRNDVERIFCESTSLSYKKKVEYKEIINDIFLKYFDKHITYKTNDLFINIYNNKLYKLENKNDIYENDRS